jgi:hypothetical protein
MYNHFFLYFAAVESSATLTKFNYRSSTKSEQLLSNTKWAISWENKLHLDEIMMMSAFYQTNMLRWIFIVLAHWNNSSRVDMSFHLRHIIRIPSHSFMHNREVANTSSIVFGLTTPGLKPTIYCSQGVCVNHYTTNEFCRTFYIIHNAYLQYKATLKKINLSCGHFTLQGFDWQPNVMDFLTR